MHLLTEFTSKMREVTRFRVQSHGMVQVDEWGVFTAVAQMPRLLSWDRRRPQLLTAS